MNKNWLMQKSTTKIKQQALSNLATKKKKRSE